MKIALAQINTTVGDLAGNVEQCLDAIKAAQRDTPDLIVFPEMTIPGYPPRDILFDSSFVEAVAQATQDLANRASDAPPIVVGTLWSAEQSQPDHPGLYNAAVLLDGGMTKLVAAKRLLPAYDVFHEPRWFMPGPALPPIDIAGEKIGFLVCEDLWDEGYPVHPGDELVEAGATLLVCISASPYRQTALEQRLYHARRQRRPVVYVNLCGATDELIFDGRSFVVDASGEFISNPLGFEPTVHIIDLAQKITESIEPRPVVEDLFEVLVIGIRDFAQKNQLSQAFLGLSGGIDSALVAVLAAEALGPNVTAVAIPSRYSDPRSAESAQMLAQQLNLNFEIVELEELHQAAEHTLSTLLDSGTTAENIQARLRGMILMSFVNRHQGMLLNTSNKTELSLGYATLYGDMAGTLCPIADLTKGDVVKLSKWLHEQKGVIPRYILDRAPSAELKADQVDPFEYDTVAPAMEKLVQANQSNGPLRRSEHKRWQMGVILKVSEKAFGTGRMIPITRR